MNNLLYILVTSVMRIHAMACLSMPILSNVKTKLTISYFEIKNSKCKIFH